MLEFFRIYLFSLFIYYFYIIVVLKKNNFKNIRKNEILINIKYDNNTNIINDTRYMLYADNDVLILTDDFKFNLTKIVYNGSKNIIIYTYYYNGILKKLSNYILGNYSENGVFSYSYHRHENEYTFYENGNIKKIKIFEINEFEKNIYLKEFLFYHNDGVFVPIV
jgi:hypothetical protein